MGKDLTFKIDDVTVNIRAGIILRFGDKVLVEISKVGKNSVIPGGRVRTYQESRNTIKRELLEEMDFSIDEDKIKLKKTIENLFRIEEDRIHELYFLYEYSLNDQEYKYLNNLNNNKDNKTTYFEFVEISDLDNVNLLPKVVIDIIRNS